MTIEKWRCPECETYNTSEACVICGSPKPENGAIEADITSEAKIVFNSYDKPPKKQPELVIALDEEEYWFCMNCGAPNAKFTPSCIKCGFDLESWYKPEAKVYCEKCGKENYKGDRYCYKCGYKLKKRSSKKKRSHFAEIILTIDLIILVMAVIAVLFLLLVPSQQHLLLG